MSRILQVIAQVVGVPLLLVLVVLFNLLELTYAVDLVRAGWLLLLFFGGPVMLAVLYWAALAASAPLSVAMDDESSTGARVLGIAVAPAGCALGFVWWQVQNWFVYGVMDADPHFYNWLFDRVGLGI